MNGTQTWQLNANAMGPNADTEIAQRLISMEPMVRFRGFPKVGDNKTDLSLMAGIGYKS